MAGVLGVADGGDGVKTIEECLGWYLDWPDGSAQHKVWFDQNGCRTGAGSASTDVLLSWLRDNVGTPLSIHYSGTSCVWEVIAPDHERKICVTTHRDLRMALCLAIRSLVDEM